MKGAGGSGAKDQWPGKFLIRSRRSEIWTGLIKKEFCAEGVGSLDGFCILQVGQHDAQRLLEGGLICDAFEDLETLMPGRTRSTKTMETVGPVIGAVVMAVGRLRLGAPLPAG